MAFWLLLWYLAAEKVGLALLLPGPLEVLGRLGQLAGTAVFWRTVAASLLRVLAGFAGGAVLGALLAVLTCGVGLADMLLSPAIRVIRATPVASFILLATLWLQSGVLPGFIAALMVLPVVWANTVAGIGAADPQLLELARCYRFGPWKTLTLVYLPTVAPYVRSACVTALGLAWKSGVAAEVISAPRMAIGRSLNEAKIYLETPELFAWTLTVIVLSLGMERVLGAVLNRLPGGDRL